MLRQITSEVQLLVEGADVEGFCEGVRQHLVRLRQRIDHRNPDPVQTALEGIQIQNFGGVTQLGEFLKGFVKMSDFSGVTSVGIIRDAEGKAADAFKSVQGCLKDARLDVPPHDSRACRRTSGDHGDGPPRRQPGRYAGDSVV